MVPSITTDAQTNEAKIKGLIEDSRLLLGLLLKGEVYPIKTRAIDPNLLINEVKVEGDHVKFRRAKIKELEYEGTNGEKLTRTVISGSKGAIVLPIFKFEGQDYAVLIFAPYPAIGRWGIQCPGGGSEKGEDSETTAKRELPEETGFEGGNFVHVANMAHAPNRYAAMDDIFIARNVSYAKRKTTEAEEQDIKVVLTPVNLLPELLDSGAIAQAVSRSTIELYLRKYSKPEL